MSKLFNTIRIAFILALVRTFGSYKHSVWNGQFNYVVYEWCGVEWAFPTGPIEKGSS